MALQLEPVDLPPDAIEVARIGDAWGVKGWVKVLPFSADPQALFSSRRWYVQASDRGSRAFDGNALLRVRQAREHSGAVVAQIDGVDDRDAAEALRGTRVFVSRSSFPGTATDEYYWVDLIGLEVVNRKGEALGRVKELLQTAAQTVLVLQYAEGDVWLERMIPFVAAYVDAVDLDGRRITVDWQADY
jgi:16S rRNA processing protein RimM